MKTGLKYAILLKTTAKDTEMGSEIFTIGYAGFPDIGDFIGELKGHGITTLIDIRRRPYQAYFEQYEENSLRNVLTREDLAYIKFYGDFGMGEIEYEEEPELPVDFEEVAKTEGFAKGISRLIFGLEKGLVPVLMGEAMDPAMCARGLLIGRALFQMGYTVKHIMPGGIKDHSELEKEIIDFARAERADADQLSLLPEDDQETAASDGDLLSEGYRRLNRMLF